ncbi:hypothetical protein FACS1894152_8470 [Bacilli bacterium]|nr:hypothetical protein FACS1894152_8470 [Bacilli bacterium]
MVTRLVVVRHGNTFDKGQKVVRVGLKTDMPLSSSGQEQAVALGRYLKLTRLLPDKVFSGKLCRTHETAEIALREAGIHCDVKKLGIFNEVDYGPDEGKTEEELIERIGADALELWNSSAILPPDWIFDDKLAVRNWCSFASMVEKKYQDKIVMVFTSNGIARFSPYITGDFDSFAKKFDIKMSTGAISIFEKNGKETNWNAVEWNLKPKDYVR